MVLQDPPPTSAPGAGARASAWQAQITRESAADVEIVVVRGRLGTRGADSLAATLDAMDSRAATPWVIDLTGVDYISSPALRLLDRAATRCGEAGLRMVLCGVDDAVRIGLELSGLVERLDVAATRDDAVARARAAS